MTFKENQKKVSDFLKGLIKEDSSAEFVGQVGDVNKAIEEMSRDHDTSLHEAQVAKDKLVEFVTSGVTSKADEPTAETKSLDDVLKDELDKIKD